MLLSKFAMAAMLFWMAALALYLHQSYALKGGPYYYIANQPAGENPVQPKYRLTYKKMREFPEVWEVHNGPQGFPVMIKVLSYGRERTRKYFYYGRDGRLRYEGYGKDGREFMKKITEAN